MRQSTGYRRDQNGYALIGVMVLMIVSLLVVLGAVRVAGSTARTVYATKVRSEQYFESEESIGRAVSWLRANSQSLVSPFRREEFYTRFARTAATTGSNEGPIFTVPTRLKIAGGNNSAILTNDSTLGTGAFPVTEDITTNITFPAVTSFSSASLGSSKIRVTVVDAIADDPTKDYGPPPAAAPETDFHPIYRIDAMRENDRGSHVYATVVADMVHLFDVGIYGQDYLEIRQQCDSYNSASGGYGGANVHANCPAGSNSTSQIHQSEKIFGSLQTNGEIVEDSPYGGDVCADFTSGCPNPGEVCSGEDCGVPLLERFDAWATYCPSDQGNVTVSSNSTMTVPGAAPGQKCWNQITVNTNRTLTLTTTDYPYFFKTLTLQNNSNSRLQVDPADATKTVTLYVETITGNSFNGNQMINTDGRPINFKMYYLGTNTLTLNGNAEMNIALVAPNAQVNISGSFTFKGAVAAKRLVLTGSGDIHYDESLGGTGNLTDSQYRVRETVQYYR